MDVVFTLNTSRPVMLAYLAYYFVGKNQYFYYIFLYMLVTSSVCMIGLIAHDNMFFVYVEHLRSFRHRWVMIKRHGVSHQVHT